MNEERKKERKKEEKMATIEKERMKESMNE